MQMQGKETFLLHEFFSVNILAFASQVWISLNSLQEFLACILCNYPKTTLFGSLNYADTNFKRYMHPYQYHTSHPPGLILAICYMFYFFKCQLNFIVEMKT